MISEEQKDLVAYLYKNDCPIKDVMRRSGVKSEQTIYRILKVRGIALRPKLIDSTGKMTLTFEKDIYKLLQRKHYPSVYVNEAIKFFEESRKSMEEKLSRIEQDFIVWESARKNKE